MRGVLGACDFGSVFEQLIKDQVVLVELQVYSFILLKEVKL